MNYLHDYHAGNFADVLKHVLISQILLSLQQKEAPFCYFDTHAGSGLYDLSGNSAQKTKEYLLGIHKVLAQKKIREFFKPYVELVKKLNPEKLKLYPGSPKIAAEFLRKQDEMILIEKHPVVFRQLKSHFYDSRVHIHSRDGYEALLALIPFKQKRGLIVIDPAFEVNNELDLLRKAILATIQKMQHGIYLIWYPIKNKKDIERFQNALSNNIHQVAHINFFIQAHDINLGLAGCGISLVNPPWQAMTDLEDNLRWLWEILSIEKRGGFQLITAAASKQGF